MFQASLVLIKGGGDLASGVAMRLHRVGFPVAITEVERPLAVRRGAAFAEAIFRGETQVEEIRAIRSDVDDIPVLLAQGVIPVLIDPHAASLAHLRPRFVIDAIMAKHNLGTAITDAPGVVALGPGFSAGIDCHAVIETNRGHTLGRVIWDGPADADTGQPGEVPGFGARGSRVLRASRVGHINAAYPIGAQIAAGARIATMTADHDEVFSIDAPFAGVLRGVIHPSVRVAAGMKIGDLDPRIQPANCFTVSDKALAIGGGVLEAVLMLLRSEPSLPS